MIEGLKQYLRYRSLGLPWINAIPEHWEMIPNRALMQEQRKIVGKNAADYTLLSLTLSGIIPRDMENPKGKFPAQFNTYKIVRPEDLVFCLFDIDETPRAVGHSKLKGMVTGAYDVFTPRQCTNARYLYHYYLFIDEGKRLKPLYTGLRKTIQRGVFASLKAPCPPLDEQAAIVRFLDHANRNIDGFIRAKRKLIALLAEQKQAITHHAVTRGINPNVPLKPSGIPWLGDIPKNWEVLRSKYLFREVDQRSKSGEETHLSMSQKLGLVPNKEIEARRLISVSYAGAKLCEKGDLVLNRLKAHLGVFALAPQPGLVSPDYTVLRPIRKLESRYFGAVYRSTACRVELRQRAKGIVQGFWRLYTDDFYDIRMPVPPVTEQTQIMDHLEGALKQQSTAIFRTEREIALMQEYRTRLTADIVTGKLDVREAAARLPDLLQDAEPPPDAEALDDELLGESEPEGKYE